MNLVSLNEAGDHCESWSIAYRHKLTEIKQKIIIERVMVASD